MKKEFYILVACFITIQVSAQSLSPTILNSAGGSNVINGIHYDWSFGEMTLINTFSKTNLIVTQGVLQSRTDTSATGITIIPSPAPDITVYPNPARNSIHISANYATSGKLHYTVTDAEGKIIRSKQLTVLKGNDQQTIDLTELPSGMYFLQLITTQENQTYYQTSKIQKIN